jgi:hypothetical protein
MLASLSLASLLVAVTTIIHIAGISLVAMLIKTYADHWRYRHPFIRAQKVGEVVLLMFFLSLVEIAVWAGLSAGGRYQPNGEGALFFHGHVYHPWIRRRYH